jgi:PST family polysaccharide transporter
MSQILRNVSRGSFYLAAEQATSLASGVVYSFAVLRWLGPGDYGLLSLGLAVIGLVSIGTGNFETYLERYAAEFETRGKGERLFRAWGLALGVKLGLGMLTASLLWAGSVWIASQYGEARLEQLLLFLSGLLVVESFLTTGRAVLFGLQRFGWVAASALIFHATKVVAVLLLWAGEAGVLELALALVAVTALAGVLQTAFAVFFLRRGPRAVGPPVPPSVQAAAEPDLFRPEAAAPEVGDPPLLASMLRYCLPLLGARAAFLASQNLSRAVLGKFLSLEHLGYFSFAFTVVDRFVSFVYALPSSLLPSLTQLVAQGDRRRFGRLLDKSFRLIATAAATLSFGIFVFAEEITLLLGGPQYQAAVPVLTVMALVPWVRTAQQPLTMGFYALRQTAWVLALALLKLSVEFGGYFLLIPSFGVQGAAWAHVGGAVVSFAAALLLIGRELGPGRHRWVVAAKASILFLVAASVKLVLEQSGAGLALGLATKLLVLAPGFLLAIFVGDLVTEDDLRRTANLEIRPSWARRTRDAVVGTALRLSRAVGTWRPSSLATAESN